MSRERLSSLGAPSSSIPGSKTSVFQDYEKTKGFHVLQSGYMMRWSTYVPTTSVARGVVFILHGYGDHMESCTQVNIAEHYLRRCGLACVIMDQPGHGLSCGDACAIWDWFDHVDMVREFVTDFVYPFYKKIDDANLVESKTGQRLPKFCHGLSMGGGIAVTLAIKHPGLFDSLILVAPMVYVSDHLRPSKAAETILKKVILPLIPAWPIFPNSNLSDMCYTDADHAKKMMIREDENPVCYRGKARVCTAFSLGVQYDLFIRREMKNIDVPFLVLHGEEDIVTSPEMSKTLYEVANANPKVI